MLSALPASVIIILTSAMLFVMLLPIIKNENYEHSNLAVALAWTALVIAGYFLHLLFETFIFSNILALFGLRIPIIV